MLKYLDFLNQCRAELDDLISNNCIDEYVRFSGEKVATIYNNLSAAVARNEDTTELTFVLLTLAAYHADALMRVKLFRDAFEFEITVLALAAQQVDFRPDFALVTLHNYIHAIDALDNLAQKLDPDDDFSGPHIAWIAQYLFSLLYFYYNAAGRQFPDDPILNIAYNILHQNMDKVAMKNGKVVTPDDLVDPSTPIPIFNDLIGRAVALGLISNQQS